MSEDGSSPGPTASFSVLARMASTIRSPAPPTATTTDTAMHRSPAEP